MLKKLVLATMIMGCFVSEAYCSAAASTAAERERARKERVDECKANAAHTRESALNSIREDHDMIPSARQQATAGVERDYEESLKKCDSIA